MGYISESNVVQNWIQSSYINKLDTEAGIIPTV